MADFIDREAVLTKIHQYTRHHWPTVSYVESIIKEQPAADVAPVVHGRWIEDHDYLKCPECGVMVKWDFTFFDIGNWNYCPNCGSKMDSKEEDGGKEVKHDET